MKKHIDIYILKTWHMCLVLEDRQSHDGTSIPFFRAASALTISLQVHSSSISFGKRPHQLTLLCICTRTLADSHWSNLILMARLCNSISLNDGQSLNILPYVVPVSKQSTREGEEHEVEWYLQGIFLHLLIFSDF